MISAQDELEKFLDRRARVFERGLARLARAIVIERSDYEAALATLAEILRETLILADLHGRKRMLMEADAAVRAGRFAVSPIANLPFEEAIADLIGREPRLAATADEVSRLYNTDHVFGMARSSSLKLTERVQEAINQLLLDGKTTYETEAAIMEAALEASHDWTRSYAQTVYRTNLSTAYAQGRLAQARDPAVAEIIPAVEYVAQLDARTRPNHAAAHGFISAPDDPFWRWMGPPAGFSCRCVLEHVSLYELQRRGLWRDGRVIRYEPPGFGNAHPDGPPFSVGRF